MTHEDGGGGPIVRIGSALVRGYWVMVDAPVPQGLLSAEDLADLVVQEEDHAARRERLQTISLT
ncbi:hypothetical protein [Streptosporangium carneum]|uniref:hypothetical protein n=1 Tax=Streptosporangium carneum TaxID=47481 RepID=UPI0022F2E10A|nr:hypothetical protein [Streptosporangium carneum]